ncbi:MAG: hypothetical protein K6F93_03035 [Lachnospiraceae bacterium]|nr:hypothetical protein [Lachnospiraceae bacterium]
MINTAAERKTLFAVIGAVLIIALIAVFPGEKAKASDLINVNYSSGADNPYGYAWLTDAQKELYVNLDEALTDFVDSDDFSKKELVLKEAVVRAEYTGNLTADEIIKTYTVFRADRPVYFFLGSLYSYSAGEGGNLCVYPDSHYLTALSRRRAEAYIKHVREIWLQKIAQIRNDGDTSDNNTEDVYDIARLLHDEIIERIDYAYENGVPSEAGWAHSLVGVFAADGAVCEGYAKAFKYMLDLADIENVYITGNGGGEAHAWNAVKIGDKYYPVDVTWDDLKKGPSSKTSPAGYYDWFCIPADKFNTKHTPDSASSLYELPELAESDEYMYYKKYGSYSEQTLTNKTAAELVGNAKDAAPGAYVYYVVPDTDSVSKLFGSLEIAGGSYISGLFGKIFIYIDESKYADPVADDWVFEEEEAWEAAGGTGSEFEVIDGGTKTIWAKGSKEFSKVTLKTTLRATSYKDAKGKTKKGKLGFVVLTENTGVSFDTTTHKVLTKNQKDIASVSNKGVVSAKAPGIAYVYAYDTGSFKVEKFTVNVLMAPTKVELTEVAGSSDKNDLIKKLVLEPGETRNVYIKGTAKGITVDSNTTYSVILEGEAKKILTASEIKKDGMGNPYFQITAGEKPLNATKVTKAKVTVVNGESGKKATLNVIVGNPVYGVEVTGSGSLKEKGDKAVLKVSYVTPYGTGLQTTDTVKVVASSFEPDIDGKKMTVDKEDLGISVKYDKKTGTLTVTAKKNVEDGGEVYLALKDKGTGEMRVILICGVSHSGELILE